MEIALKTLNQLTIMLVFMLLGYGFVKRGKLRADASETLSSVSINIFMPALCFLTLAEDLKLSDLSEKSGLFLLSIAIIVVLHIVSGFMSKPFSKNGGTRDVYKISFVISNFMYIGFPIIDAVFGKGAMLDAVIFGLPFVIYNYTVSMYILTGRRKITLSFLFSPVIIATVLGIVCGLCSVVLPKLVTDILGMAKGCMTPCIMLLTGVVFGRMSLKKVFGNPKVYIASAIRLIAIPLLALLILRLCGAPQNLVVTLISNLAMPFGVGIIVFLENSGGDSETAASLSFISSVAGIVTIPIIFGIL